MSTTRTPKKTFMGISTRARVRPNVTRHSEESKVENQKGCTTQESERRDVVVWNRDRVLGRAGPSIRALRTHPKSEQNSYRSHFVSALNNYIVSCPSVRCFGRPLGGGVFAFILVRASPEESVAIPGFLGVRELKRWVAVVPLRETARLGLFTLAAMPPGDR